MYKITLNCVKDNVVIQGDGGEKLRLRVFDRPYNMAAKLIFARSMIRGVTEYSTDEQKYNAALAITYAIFKKDQAKALMDFCDNNPASVVNVCSKYFDRRLKHLLIKQLKKENRRAK